MLLLTIIIIITGLIIILDKSDKYKKNIHNEDKLVIKAAMSAEKDD